MEDHGVETIRYRDVAYGFIIAGVAILGVLAWTFKAKEPQKPED